MRAATGLVLMLCVGCGTRVELLGSLGGSESDVPNRTGFTPGLYLGENVCDSGTSSRMYVVVGNSGLLQVGETGQPEVLDGMDITPGIEVSLGGRILFVVKSVNPVEGLLTVDYWVVDADGQLTETMTEAYQSVAPDAISVASTIVTDKGVVVRDCSATLRLFN